jgi:hypothetical protein
MICLSLSENRTSENEDLQLIGDVTMSERTYAFRITCSLAGGVIESVEPTVLLTLPDLPTIEVHLTAKDDENKLSDITVWCSGFKSEAEAHSAGSRVKTALVLAGIVLGVGIDAGNDQISGPAFTTKDGKPDERLQPEVHGLQVVPDIDGLIFGSLQFGRPYTPISPDTFQKKVAECYALDKALSQKQVLAAQLYNHSHFHATDAVRFVTLISSVESLAERRKRHSQVLDLIEQMVQMASKTLGSREANTQSLIGGLRNLQYESIGTACRTLVKEYCGDDKAKAFARQYEIRSRLLHNGAPPAEIDLNLEVIRLDNLVRLLLVRNFSRVRSGAAA